MTNLKRFSWIVLVATMAVSLIVAAQAHTDSGEAIIEVVPFSNGRGILTVSITNVDFGEHEYRLTDHTASGSVTIYTSDMRGTAGGWTVTLAGSDFNSAEAPAYPVSIDNLNAPAGTMNHIGGASGHSTDEAPLPLAVRPVTLAPSAAIYAKPGTGAGYYQNHRPNTQLTVPGGTLIGGYQATLTVTITGNNP